MTVVREGRRTRGDEPTTVDLDETLPLGGRAVLSTTLLARRQASWTRAALVDRARKCLVVAEATPRSEG